MPQRTLAPQTAYKPSHPDLAREAPPKRRAAILKIVKTLARPDQAPHSALASCETGCYNQRRAMIIEYIRTALAKARYERIDDPQPVYAAIPGLRGIWATGKTRDACKRHLSEVLEGWIIVRLRKGLPIPKIDGKSLTHATRLPVNA